MVIRHIGPGSCAKVAGILYALIGLIIGAGASLVAMTIGHFVPNQYQSASPMIGMAFGAGAIIILPIVYGIVGAVTAAISAVIYNIVAGIVGGIEIAVDGAPAMPGGPSAS